MSERSGSICPSSEGNFLVSRFFVQLSSWLSIGVRVVKSLSTVDNGFILPLRTLVSQAVLEAGVLPYLEGLLQHTKKNIRKVK